MFKRLLVGTVLVAALALFLSQNEPPQRPPYVRGRNKTALFVVNAEPGLSNVHVATASALMEGYPDIQVHFASFPRIKSSLARASAFARKKVPEARDIIFHELRGPSYADSVIMVGKELANIAHPPGAAGIGHLCKDMQIWLSPWSTEDHLDIYEQLNTIIDQVDPAVVVLETLFRPGMDATRDKNRQHALITPNPLVDTFMGHQPYGSMFWKYPAVGSGFSFPVPWRHIPENIYLNLRFIYSVVMTPGLTSKRKILREHGIKDPINFFAIYRPDVPWISMTTEGASIPIDVVPPNVTTTGPIVISAAPATEQDPELVDWLKRAPTVLINLGSSVIWTEKQATIMVEAIAEVMKRTNLQFLWKFKKHSDFSDEFLSPVKVHVDNGRLRMHKWLTTDPTSLLESGHIVASVHHGGANCYQEAVYAGVPHVILPQWADCYNNAGLAQTIGVGEWACRDTSPDWTAEELTRAMLKVLDGGEASIAMREKARQLGERVQAAEKGRDIAARTVARLAYAGVA
ncbi:hypothetical protein ACJ41O_006097 [Fusarium nematophilum]